MDTSKPLIGFIGQGFIGKNYADDFEERGFRVIRYALEEPYRNNKERIKEGDVVFIAVPTPTTPKGFDGSIVEEALSLVGEGKIAVIKSTILPGTTKKLQKKYPGITLFYSPEFLSESTAAHDAAHPFSNIVGMPQSSGVHTKAAELVHSVLPKASAVFTCDSTEAEIVKYSHNVSAYAQIVMFNILYDLARALGCDWENIERAITADPYVCNRYARPVDKGGRGAGGHCFIKDMAALRSMYRSAAGDERGEKVLLALEEKNAQLLRESGKTVDLWEGVYGREAPAPQ